MTMLKSIIVLLGLAAIILFSRTSTFAVDKAEINVPSIIIPLETREDDPAVKSSGAVRLVDPTTYKTLTIGTGYWSMLISEETPPATCQNQYLISGMECIGSYCDNVAVRCENKSRAFGKNYWTTYFSEESTNYRYCQQPYFMTGVSCQGGYCDNMSIQCTEILNTTRGSCYWTPYFSEEAQWSYLRPGYYAVGIACKGSNCDNISIYACQAL